MFNFYTGKFLLGNFLVPSNLEQGLLISKL